jgi:hypothetical protein
LPGAIEAVAKAAPSEDEAGAEFPAQARYDRFDRISVRPIGCAIEVLAQLTRRHGPILLMGKIIQQAEFQRRQLHWNAIEDRAHAHRIEAQASNIDNI